MRRMSVSFAAAIVLLHLSGCGGDQHLGSVDGQPLTREEYFEVFNGLPASEQVDVLEPGGRMALMEKIVRKKLLILAWEEDPSISSGIEELYAVSFLSDSMFRRIASEYDPALYTDSLASCGYSGFQLRTVLLDDSAGAATLAERWSEGDFDNSIPSVTAPWSAAGGGSYRTLGGPLHRFTASFEPLLSLEQGTAHVLPMHGEWCVCVLELIPGQWTPDDNAASAGLMVHLSRASGEEVFSRGVEALADNVVPSETVLIPSGEGDDTPLFAVGTDTVTVAEVLDMMRVASPENFFGSVPEELGFLAPPRFSMSPELTLWFYARNLAQRYSMWKMAVEAGIELADGTLDYPRAESVVRERVFRNAMPDSASVEEWFEANSDMYVLPERRSVLLGYTDSLTAASISYPAEFGDIPGLQTVLDSTGAMMPTPPQVQESFGQVLGQEIFQAEPGVLNGPVYLDGELAAWFEVVRVEPPGVADLQEIFPVVSAAAAMEMFEEGFEELIRDLRTEYPVEIDTAAVVEIDLWGSVH